MLIKIECLSRYYINGALEMSAKELKVSKEVEHGPQTSIINQEALLLKI
jgi:hypothetical protein